MYESVYVGQGKLTSSSDYFIDAIAGDPATWTAITVPLDYFCRAITLVARSSNDVVFNHDEIRTEFHFAKTSSPGIDWVHVIGSLSIPIIKSPGEIIGYVRSDTGTYVVILGVD